MYVVESKGGTIACMLLALLLLGTWPAILTLLERRARLPQHTYLDYSITNLSAAVLIALTFGQIGETKADMPNFLTQLSQDNWPCVLFTMVGGVFLSLGNLSTQYAFAFLGLSVTEVITASITVVIVLLGAAVHSSNAADNKAKLGYLSSNYKEGARDIEFLGLKDVSNEGGKDLENGSIPVEKAKFGTADFLVELGNRRSIKFSPAFNLATNDQWHTMQKGVPHLVVYAAFFYFSVSCFVIGIVLNIIFLYHPILNLPKSSLKAYVNDWNGRNWAFLAGLLCGFGDGL